MTKANESPLGSLSVHYLTQKDGILDNPSSGYLELYPAGYTKQRLDGKSRQDLHRQLYSRVQDQYILSHGSTPPTAMTKLFIPTSMASDFPIKLVREHNNEYDPNATRILFLHTGEELGYVPKKISNYIASFLNWFYNGEIVSVRRDYHGKYFTSKVRLYYTNPIVEITHKYHRFMTLMDENQA